MRERTLAVMAGFTQLLDAPYPEGLELGDTHDAYAADRGGDIFFMTGFDNVRRRLPTAERDSGS
jgi:hypothetical protein